MDKPALEIVSKSGVGKQGASELVAITPKQRTMNKPWIADIVRELPTSPVLTREEFTKKYFPQYVNEWQPDYRIRCRSHSAIPTRMPNAGDFKRQRTRRANIIDAAYSEYTTLKTANHSSPVS